MPTFRYFQKLRIVWSYKVSFLAHFEHKVAIKEMDSSGLTPNGRLQTSQEKCVF